MKSCKGKGNSKEEEDQIKLPPISVERNRSSKKNTGSAHYQMTIQDIASNSSLYGPDSLFGHTMTIYEEDFIEGNTQVPIACCQIRKYKRWTPEMKSFA